MKPNEPSRNTIVYLAAHPKICFVVMLVLASMNFIAVAYYWQHTLKIDITKQGNLLVSLFGFSTAAVSLPVVASFLYRSSKSLQPLVERIIDPAKNEGLNVTNWFHNQITFIYGSRWTYLIGTIFAVAAIGTLFLVGFQGSWSTDTTTMPDVISTSITPAPVQIAIILICFMGISFMAVGIVTWIFFGLLLFLSRLKDLEPRALVFQWPELEIKLLTAAYHGMFAVGVILYIITVSALWVLAGPYAGEYATSSPFALWIIPFAVLVISFFLLYLYHIHLLIMRSKQQRLDQISEVVTKQFTDLSTSPTTEIAKVMTDMMDIRGRIRDESEWPIDLAAALAVVTGLLLPVATSIVSSIFA